MHLGLKPAGRAERRTTTKIERLIVWHTGSAAVVRGKSASGAPSSEFASLVRSSRGSPIPAPVQNRMQGMFGKPFHDVHLHTDAAAKSASRQINAEAFTIGRDVYFAGSLDTRSPRGLAILGHELTHVVQGGTSIRRMAHAILPDGKLAPPDGYVGGFHGATIPPEVVLKEGFKGRGKDWRLYDHAVAQSDPELGGTAFRGTTMIASNPEGGQGAAYWADEGGWVYEISGVPSWNVRKWLDPYDGKVIKGHVHSLAGVRGEAEYSIPAEVPPHKIKRYGQVKNRRERLYVPEWTLNPSFQPGAWNPADAPQNLPPPPPPVQAPARARAASRSSVTSSRTSRRSAAARRPSGRSCRATPPRSRTGSSTPGHRADSSPCRSTPPTATPSSPCTRPPRATAASAAPWACSRRESGARASRSARTTTTSAPRSRTSRRSTARSRAGARSRCRSRPGQPGPV
jgi:hypothetical protein